MNDESLRDTTREPVAWAAIDGYGRVVFAAPSAAACGGVEPLTPRRIVPLYRDPPCQVFLRKNLTLTDAEREALRAIRRTVMYQPHADAIDAILARLGGGE